MKDRASDPGEWLPIKSQLGLKGDEFSKSVGNQEVEGSNPTLARIFLSEFSLKGTCKQSFSQFMQELSNHKLCALESYMVDYTKGINATML